MKKLSKTQSALLAEITEKGRVMAPIFGSAKVSGWWRTAKSLERLGLALIKDMSVYQPSEQ